MNWKIFTKQVETGEGGIAVRWFWRAPVLEGRRESPVGFTSRAACEADAAQHGYTNDQETRRTFGE